MKNDFDHNSQTVCNPETIHKNTQEIAKTVATTHNIEQNMLNKTDIIGQALISQQEAIQTLTESQYDNHVKTSNQLETAEQSLQNILSDITRVSDYIQTFTTVRDEQNNLLALLQDTHKTYNEFITSNQAIRDITSYSFNNIETSLAEAEKHLQMLVETNNIQIVSHQLQEIYTKLKQHTDTRTKEQVRLESLYSHFIQDIETLSNQISMISQIMTIVNDYAKHIDTLDEKVDELLAQQANCQNITLEDAFMGENNHVKDVTKQTLWETFKNQLGGK